MARDGSDDVASDALEVSPAGVDGDALTEANGAGCAAGWAVTTATAIRDPDTANSSATGNSCQANSARPFVASNAKNFLTPATVRAPAQASVHQPQDPAETVSLTGPGHRRAPPDDPGTVKKVKNPSRDVIERARRRWRSVAGRALLASYTTSDRIVTATGRRTAPVIAAARTRIAPVTAAAQTLTGRVLLAWYDAPTTLTALQATGPAQLRHHVTMLRARIHRDHHQLALVAAVIMLGTTIVGVPVVGAADTGPVRPLTAPACPAPYTGPSCADTPAEPVVPAPLGAPCPTVEELGVQTVSEEAPFYRQQRLSDVRWIVIHSAQAPIAPGWETEVGEYLANVERITSVHYIVGPDQIVEMVPLESTAFGAGAMNDAGIQIELLGYAEYDRDQWLADDHALRMLCRGAHLAARLAATFDIPVAHVDTAGLLVDTPGIAGHVAFSEAFKGSDHWDPGPGFPWKEFIAQVAHYRLTATPFPVDPSVEGPATVITDPTGTAATDPGATSRIKDVPTVPAP